MHPAKRIAAALFMAASAATLATPAMADDGPDFSASVVAPGVTYPEPLSMHATDASTAATAADGPFSDPDVGYDPGSITTTGTITSTSMPITFSGTATPIVM
ncbi:hypothetical protein [Streptomyces sp. NPDC001661]